MSNDKFDESSPRIDNEVVDDKIDVDDYSDDIYHTEKFDDISFDEIQDAYKDQQVSKPVDDVIDEIEEVVYKSVDGKCSCNDLSVFKVRFWDLWLQKIFRNLASVKYQLLISFYWLVVYGMFFARDLHGNPIISSTAGLTFLGGGFVSIATARLIVKSSLFEHDDYVTRVSEKQGIDTDR